jgi:hypothetical protein
MNTLSSSLDTLSLGVSSTLNFILERISRFRPNIPTVDPFATTKHKDVVKHALSKYCYPRQLETVLHGYTRHEVTEELVLQDFFAGNVPKHDVIKDANYTNALEFTRLAFAPPSPVRPVHIFDVQHHYPLKNRPNAEAPFSTDKFFLDMIPPNTKASTGNMKPIIFDFTRRWHHEIKEASEPAHRYLYFMILHIKTALVTSNSPPKARCIFGVPKPWIIAHIMFLWPLFAHYKSHKGSTPLLWGYETFNGGWMRLNYELMHRYMRTSILMIDWKRFDKHAQFTVLNDIFGITRSFLDFSRGYVPTTDYPDTESDWSPSKEARLQRLWQWTIDAFYETPTLLPDGRLIKRQHAGIPSGLYPTQFFDSLYNCVMLITILFAMDIPVTKEMLIKLMGDDSLIRLLILIQPNEHAAFFSKMQHFASLYFGSTISIDKSKISNHPNGAEVLSYVNHNGLPHRDPTALMAQLYHTKARKPTPGKTMASAIGIAYASCGFDRQVYYVCKDIYAHYFSQGIEPDPAGLTLALGDDPFGIRPSDISLTHFPSLHEIQANLTALDYVSDSISRFWPTDHFLEPY